jgi:hypothetical protein
VNDEGHPGQGGQLVNTSTPSRIAPAGAVVAMRHTVAVGRFDFERALRASSLPAVARHVALTLATWTTADAGTIPRQFSPSLSTLAVATGLAKTTVAKHLAVLEVQGWLIRKRPPVEAQRKKHAQTTYQLRRPASAGDALPSAGRAPELVRETSEASAGDAHKSSKSISQSGAGASASGALARCANGELVAVDGFCCADHAGDSVNLAGRVAFRGAS